MENLQEDSLMAQQTVYDAVKDCHGMAAVDITKAVLQCIHGTMASYKDALERKRKVAAAETKNCTEETTKERH